MKIRKIIAKLLIRSLSEKTLSTTKYSFKNHNIAKALLAIDNI